MFVWGSTAVTYSGTIQNIFLTAQQISSSVVITLLTKVRADLGHPLPTVRSALHLASFRLTRPLSPPTDHRLAGNFFNISFRPRCFSFLEFSISILSFYHVLPSAHVKVYGLYLCIHGREPVIEHVRVVGQSTDSL